MTLDSLAESLEERCGGRMIHFGSCQTFNCDRRHLKRFIRRTGAIAVTGYREDVDWLDSGVFEVRLIGALQSRTLTHQGLAALRSDIDSKIKRVAENLGFIMVTKWD